ncbi:hypothetical protein [Natronobiforma cellulositropha]|uniref:hypothetical protein n=1 Tax=Natronobiforma cellulositropha TaxID=1679076 RepID=UPI0021D5E6C1|nr:hypothetical protein [Natronobiforma cellulositropha]
MIWQDLVFSFGSALSIVFLAPTLRDVSARVPLGTSLPSMGIGGVYALTFASLGMPFSAAGSAAAAGMWSLIAWYRSPSPDSPTLTTREQFRLFVADASRWTGRQRSGGDALEQYALEVSAARDGRTIGGVHAAD